MKLVPAVTLGLLLVAAGCGTTSPPAGGEPSAKAETSAGPDLAPAAFVPPSPGTIIVGHRADGTLRKTRVLGSDGYAVTLERDGERITRLPFCHACGHPRDEPVETARYAQLWPLEVGKSVTFQRTRERDGTVWVHTVRVTGTETVEAEVGTFEAYVVEQEVGGAGGNRWHGTRTDWYVPELRWNVKSEWQGSDGDSGRWEMAAIALAQ